MQALTEGIENSADISCGSDAAIARRGLASGAAKCRRGGFADGAGGDGGDLRALPPDASGRQGRRRRARQPTASGGLVSRIAALQTAFNRDLTEALKALKEGGGFWWLGGDIVPLRDRACGGAGPRQGGHLLLSPRQRAARAARRGHRLPRRLRAGARRHRHRRRDGRDPQHDQHGDHRHGEVLRGRQLRAGGGARDLSARPQGTAGAGDAARRRRSRASSSSWPRSRACARPSPPLRGRDGERGKPPRRPCSFPLPDPPPQGGRELSGAAAAILSVGIRPCSGALVVLVFALAQGMFWAGIASTFLMALGTALTVAALAALAVGAKDIARRLAPATTDAAVGSCWRWRLSRRSRHRARARALRRDDLRLRRLGKLDRLAVRRALCGVAPGFLQLERGRRAARPASPRAAIRARRARRANRLPGRRRRLPARRATSAPSVSDHSRPGEDAALVQRHRERESPRRPGRGKDGTVDVARDGGDRSERRGVRRSQGRAPRGRCGFRRPRAPPVPRPRARRRRPSRAIAGLRRARRRSHRERRARRGCGRSRRCVRAT